MGTSGTYEVEDCWLCAIWSSVLFALYTLVDTTLDTLEVLSMNEMFTMMNDFRLRGFFCGVEVSYRQSIYLLAVSSQVDVKFYKEKVDNERIYYSLKHIMTHGI